MEKKLYAIANAHLDTQWNWTIEESIEKCIKNTLIQNFILLDKYPHYRMNFEGAFRYKLVKEYYPELFEKLKQYIQSDRWNVAGSSWEACDTNIPSSESLMRQILYGNGFFEKEFGKRSRDIFLPDCFGFRWSVPSVAAHMGLIGFSTCKLVWGMSSPIYNNDGSVSRPEYGQEHKRMDLGRWRGPDGKTVLVNLLPGDYTYQFDSNGDERPVNKRQELLEQIEHNEMHTGVAIKGKYYGTGDMGGSPSENCVKLLNDACDNDDGLYQVTSASTYQIFEELTEEQIENIPVYEGNLSIPHGLGSLTSRTICKRWNRKCELLADCAEKANITAKVLQGKEYPADRLRDAWQTFLCHQFHDDLPGTSEIEAYSFSYNDYLIALNMFATELQAGIEAVASELNTQVMGTPVLVYNPASVKCTELVSAQISDFKGNIRVFTASGDELASQISTENGKTILHFVATLEPVSCTVFDIRESDKVCSLQTGLSVSENFLENSRYAVRLDNNGDISSVWDKVNCKELLNSPVRLEIIPDTSTAFPSWELNPQDINAEPKYVSETKSIEISQNGPASVALTIRRVYDKSEFKQTISLFAGSDRVDVYNEIEWYQHASLLRASYPLAVSNEFASFDQGLGTEKLGNSEFPYFQYTVHQWADITSEDESYGVSILNDCKYAMDKPNDSTLRLTLIHTPLGSFSDNSMQDWQDMGTNIFKFSIIGHTGKPDFVPAEATVMNQPPLAFITNKHVGNKYAFSLLCCNCDEVLIRAVKREEKGNRIIIRVQETSGRDLSSVKISFPCRILSAVQTNGYEEEISAVDFYENNLIFSIGHYAPMTFAVELEVFHSENKSAYFSLELPYNRKITTLNNEKSNDSIIKGISVPAELYLENMTVGGVPFVLAPAEKNNAIVCKGQKIKLPAEYKKIYFLAASTMGDKSADFYIDNKKYTLQIQSFAENLGTWDVFIDNKKKHMKSDTLGIRYTHTHDKNGDRAYSFAYFFRYCLEFENGTELTLPDDEDILIVSATAVLSSAYAKPLTEFFERFKQEKCENMRKLTISDAAGTKEHFYPANSTVLIGRHKPFDLKLGRFKGYQGKAVMGENDGVTSIEIGENDIVVTAKYEAVGNPIEFDVSSCIANSYLSFDLKPANALTESDDKWCAKLSDGCGLLESALKSTSVITGWYVAHAGVCEDANMNSKEFSLEFKQGDGEWITADYVYNNTESRTFRKIQAITADRVRLRITKPTQGEDPYARIYLFKVYSD